jgi:hypothetical protein
MKFEYVDQVQEITVAWQAVATAVARGEKRAGDALCAYYAKRDAMALRLSQLDDLVAALPKCTMHPNIVARGFDAAAPVPYYFCNLCSGPPGLDLPYAHLLPKE